MNASKGPIFLFHADANPIGGHLTHPVEYLFPPHGSSSLAQAGGQASGQLGPHRVEGIVSFESARSNVYGRKQGPEGPWTSTITSVVEKLNVLDILRADAIVTKIKINHPHVGIHPTVSFAGTHFHNLTIAGEPIHPVVDLHTFARTEEHIEKNNVRWEKDPHHLEAAKGHIKSTIEANSGLPWVEKRYGWMLNDDQRDERGHVVCSLVKAIKNGKPDPTPGHILHVPELGNIFLGEIYINHGAFRVTMLRIEMGCLAEGDMSVASGGGNGGHHAWLSLLLMPVITLTTCTSKSSLSPERLLEKQQEIFRNGDLPKALDQAKQGFERTTDGDPLHEAFRVELARVQWYSGNKPEALHLLSNPLPGNISAKIAVQHYALLAAFLSKSGRVRDAKEVLSEAEEKLERGTPDAFLEATRGEIERTGGHLKEAAAKYQSALHGAETLQDEFLQMRMLLNLGIVEIQLEQFDEGRDTSQRALSYAERLNAKVARELSTGNIGYAYLGLGNFVNAEQSFQKARAEARDAGAQADVVLWTRNQGVAKSLLGDSRGAEELYQECLRKALEQHDDEQVADTQSELGALYLDHPEIAAPHLAEAARIYAAAEMQQDLLQVELLQATSMARQGDTRLATAQLLSIDQNATTLPSLRWQAEEELALVALRQGNDSLAHVWFAKAVRTFQQQQCSIHDITSKLPFQENGTELFKTYVEHLIREGHTDQALMVYDQGRATSLRDCEDKVGDASVQRQAISVPNARLLAKRLQGTLLIYYPLPETTYLWAVSKDRTGFYRLPGEDEINKLVRRHEALVTDSLKDPIAQGDEAGRTLFDLLIGPAQAQIKPGDGVYVLADRGLSQLNFDTLLTPGEHPHFWIEDVTITNAASLRLLSESLARPLQKRTTRLLVLGDPEYPKNQNIEPLLHAADEVHKVRAHFVPASSTVLTGSSATPQAYEKQDPGQYSNIHIVAHAEANLNAPMESFVLLSGIADKLYAHDVLKYPLKADLVVLSTCYSSGTAHFSGEGVVGLAWAFERAGSRNVIGSLWEVSDDSAPELMDHMYADIASGMRPAQALRNAKLAALHSGRYSRPFYWAPFQLYSNSGEARVH